MFKPMKLPMVDGHVHMASHLGIKDMLEMSRDAGIERINIVCVPGTPERSLAANSIALLAKALHPENFYVFGGLNYNIGEAATPKGLCQQAENLKAMGCDGIKMLEGKPSTRKRIPYRMDDPVYDRYYAFLQETGFPIVWHVTDPESFWDPAQISESARKNGWDYTDGTFPAREQLYGEIDHVLGKFPRLRIIFGHFYFLSNYPERAAEFLTRWPTVSFDITPGSEMYRNFSKKPDLWHEFFAKFQDRIVFGTDNVTPRDPWTPARTGMIDKVRMIREFLETSGTLEGFGTATSKYVTGIGLGKEPLEKIYSRNFEKHAGATPKPVNMELVLRYNRRIMDFARNAPGQEELLKELTYIENAIQRM